MDTQDTSQRQYTLQDTLQDTKTSTKDEMLAIINERIQYKSEYFQRQYTTKEMLQSHFDAIKALVELADHIRYS
jgi:hypothetical protein